MVEICNSVSGARQILTSNNDSAVRLFEAEGLSNTAKFDLPWAVNYTTVNPVDPKVNCCAHSASVSGRKNANSICSCAFSAHRKARVGHALSGQIHKS